MDDACRVMDSALQVLEPAFDGIDGEVIDAILDDDDEEKEEEGDREEETAKAAMKAFIVRICHSGSVLTGIGWASFWAEARKEGWRSVSTRKRGPDGNYMEEFVLSFTWTSWLHFVYAGGTPFFDQPPQLVWCYIL
jgi:hypothetical protein